MKNYETPSIFMDIVIDEHDFEEQLCLMAPCCIDLDITEERLNYPKPPLDDKQCVIIMKNLICQLIYF